MINNNEVLNKPFAPKSLKFYVHGIGEVMLNSYVYIFRKWPDENLLNFMKTNLRLRRIAYVYFDFQKINEFLKIYGVLRRHSIIPVIPLRFYIRNRRLLKGKVFSVMGLASRIKPGSLRYHLLEFCSLVISGYSAEELQQWLLNRLKANFKLSTVKTMIKIALNHPNKFLAASKIINFLRWLSFIRRPRYAYVLGAVFVAPSRFGQSIHVCRVLRYSVEPPSESLKALVFHS
ncbi:MAG: hypothetical protein QW253_00245 [Metallosphaera sp.]